MDLPGFVDKHARRLTNHSLVYRIRWKARYLKWFLAGSGPYSDEYVEQVTASIAAGNRHPSLSVVLHNPEGARRAAGFVAETVRGHGLESSDVCIEYGCGALRIAEPIMMLLEPGHYIGLDVTDRFWKNGIQRLGSDFIERYRPHLQLIDERIGELARLNAKVVVCIAVLIHVPPPEVDAFIARLASVMGEHSTLVLDGRLGHSTRQVHGRTWHHARSRVLRTLARRGLEPVSPAPLTRTGLPEELWLLRKSRPPS